MAHPLPEASSTRTPAEINGAAYLMGYKIGSMGVPLAHSYNKSGIARRVRSGGLAADSSSMDLHFAEFHG